MKTNVQITAVKKEFKNGQNGYEVKVEGMDGKLDCKMNFHEPLKAMRYMFLLSKRLELQIDSIQLAALSLAYQRAKEAEQKAVEDAASVISEVGDAEQDADSSSRDFIVHLSILIVLRIISNCNQNILLYWIFRREFTVRQSFTNTALLFTHFLAKISPARSTQIYSEKGG